MIKYFSCTISTSQHYIQLGFVTKQKKAASLQVSVLEVSIHLKPCLQWCPKGSCLWVGLKSFSGKRQHSVFILCKGKLHVSECWPCMCIWIPVEKDSELGRKMRNSLSHLYMMSRLLTCCNYNANSYLHVGNILHARIKNFKNTTMFSERIYYNLL